MFLNLSGCHKRAGDDCLERQLRRHELRSLWSRGRSPADTTPWPGGPEGRHLGGGGGVSQHLEFYGSVAGIVANLKGTSAWEFTTDTPPPHFLSKCTVLLKRLRSWYWKLSSKFEIFKELSLTPNTDHKRKELRPIFSFRKKRNAFKGSVHQSRKLQYSGILFGTPKIVRRFFGSTLLGLT